MRDLRRGEAEWGGFFWDRVEPHATLGLGGRGAAWGGPSGGPKMRSQDLGERAVRGGPWGGGGAVWCGPWEGEAISGGLGGRTPGLPKWSPTLVLPRPEDD